MKNEVNPQNWCKVCKDYRDSLKHKEHLSKRRKWCKENSLKRKEAGVCVGCGFGFQSPEHQEHKGKNRKWDEKRSEKRMEAGLCTDCGFDLKSSEHQEHNNIKKEWSRKKSKERKEMSLCTKCGFTLRSAEHLKKCREPIKERRKINAENGLCYWHPTEKAIIKGHCEDCWFKLKATAALGTKKFGKQIKDKLIQQNYRCIYTGKILKIADNASVDHIIPKCRNGQLILDNIQWIDFEINVKYKCWMTHQNFLDLCEKTWIRKIMGEYLDERDLVLVGIWDYQLIKNINCDVELAA